MSLELPVSVIIYMVIALASSHITTLVTTPIIIKKSRAVGLVSKDLHKTYETEIPYLGGLAMLTGFLAAATLAGLTGLNSRTALGITLAAVTGATIGLIDDLFKLDKKALVILSALAGVPISTYRIGQPTLDK